MEIAMGDNGNSNKCCSLTEYDKNLLPDVHAHEETRGIEIQRVGIDDVAFPLAIARKNNGTISTLAHLDMYGSLDGKLKGTNMSRFAELLLDYGAGTLSGRDFPALLKNLAERLETQDVYMKATFDFWRTKYTPVSNRPSPMNYKCGFIGQLINGEMKFVVEAHVPVATYCPCSKAMCITDHEAGVGKGAHAQRGIVTIQAITDPVSPGMWLEDIIEVAEKAGSAEVYTLLKRPDEKYVTIQGYDNPKFVEDVARDAVKGVHKLENATWVKVRARNYESIHNHNATAYVCSKKVNGVWTSDSRAFY